MTDKLSKLIIEILGRDQYSKEFDKLNKGLKGHKEVLADIESTARKTFLVLAGGVGLATAESIKFQGEMKKVGTILEDNTRHLLPSFEAGIRSWAQASGQGTKTLADGLYDVLSAQVQANGAMQVLGESTKGAVAGFTDVKTSVSAALSFLRAYQMQANEVGKVQNFLFATVKMARTDYQGLASSIGDVTGSAALLKVPLQEIGAALSVMTQGGLSVDMSVTSLNNVLLKFLDATGPMKVAIQDIGFESAAAMIKQEGLAGAVKLVNQWAQEQPAVIRELKAAYTDLVAEGLSETQVMKALGEQFGFTDEKIKVLIKSAPDAESVLSELFGSIRAIRGLLPIAGSGAADFAKYTGYIKDEMDKGTLVAKTYNDVMEGSGVKLQQLKQTALMAAELFGQQFVPMVDSVTLKLKGLIQESGNSEKAMSQLATTAKIMLGAAFGVMVMSKLASYELQMLAVARAVWGVQAAMKGLAILNLEVAAVAAWGTVAYEVWKYWDDLGNILSRVGSTYVKVLADIMAYATVLPAALKSAFGGDDSWKKRLEDMLTDNKAAYDTLRKNAWDAAKERTGAEKSSLAECSSAYDLYLANQSAADRKALTDYQIKAEERRNLEEAHTAEAAALKEKETAAAIAQEQRQTTAHAQELAKRQEREREVLAKRREARDKLDAALLADQQKRLEDENFAEMKAEVDRDRAQRQAVEKWKSAMLDGSEKQKSLVRQATEFCMKEFDKFGMYAGRAWDLASRGVDRVSEKFRTYRMEMGKDVTELERDSRILYDQFGKLPIPWGGMLEKVRETGFSIKELPPEVDKLGEATKGVVAGVRDTIRDALIGGGRDGLDSLTDIVTKIFDGWKNKLIDAISTGFADAIMGSRVGGAVASITNQILGAFGIKGAAGQTPAANPAVQGALAAGAGSVVSGGAAGAAIGAGAGLTIGAAGGIAQAGVGAPLLATPGMPGGMIAGAIPQEFGATFPGAASGAGGGGAAGGAAHVPGLMDYAIGAGVLDYITGGGLFGKSGLVQGIWGTLTGTGGHGKGHVGAAPTMDPKDALAKAKGAVGSGWENLPGGDDLQKFINLVVMGGITNPARSSSWLWQIASAAGYSIPNANPVGWQTATRQLGVQLTSEQVATLSQLAGWQGWGSRGETGYRPEGFHRGGIPGSMSSDEIPILARRREGIVSEEGMRTLFAQLNAGQLGRAAGGGDRPEALLKVSGPLIADRRTFEWLLRQLEDLQAKRDRRATATA